MSIRLLYVLPAGREESLSCMDKKKNTNKQHTAGHEVFTPTMSGLGKRAHQLTSATGLATFIDDGCAVLECEELQDVVLVGHSFGGPVISGMADRMKQR